MAEGSDRTLLLDFLREEWDANHIFLKSNQLLDWQHFDFERSALNFVVAVEDQPRRLLGVLGFIPVAKFDRNLADAKDYWGAIWKARSTGGVPGVGLELLDFLEKTLQPSTLGMIGVTLHAEKIYRALGFRTGMLDRFYIINPEFRSFKLIVGQEKNFPSRRKDVSADAVTLVDLRGAVTRLESFVAVGQRSGKPRKSAEYFRNRYERHPIYQYYLFGIEESGRECGVVACRIARHDQARAVRVVDLIIGDEYRRLIGAVLTKLAISFKAEYADFYYAGVTRAWAESTGVKLVTTNDQLILPSYFEPFVAKNVDLRYAVKVQSDQIYEIFRGDADQDRPNMLSATTLPC